VELQNIHLLMTPNEVRMALNKSGFRFGEDEGTVAGVHGLAVHVSQPVKGIQILSFQFREGELYSMLFEYDMRYFTSFDFPAYLSQLKTKYGEPVEVKDITKEGKVPAPLHTFDAFDFRWVDEQTELKIGYSPPGGKDPLNRSIPADVVWEISDKQLAEKTREENAKRMMPRKEMTDEERNEALKKFKEELEQRHQQQQ